MSAERLVAAISCEESDRVPLYLRFFERDYLFNERRPWRSQFERARELLALGLDDVLTVHAPTALSPDVEVSIRRERDPSETHPLLVKEYRTPRGVLRQVVRLRPGWPHGDDIPLFSDYNVPRARTKRYLVEGPEDVEALSALLERPGGEVLERFLGEAEEVESFAEEHGLLVMGWGPMGGDAAVWLCGVERVVEWSFRRPELVERLLEIVLKWDLWAIEALSRLRGVYVVIHRGWYEFLWPPRLYERLIAPMHKREAEEAHRRGMRFGYMITKGIAPLLSYIREAGVDLLLGADPVQDRLDLRAVKEELDGRVCVWGGVNSAVTLRQSRGVIRRAVCEAIRVLAPGGGFILGAVDAIFKDTPGGGVRALIEAWREACRYPIRP